MKIIKSIDKVGILGSFSLVQFCPICIPAIGAFLASIGLGFIVTNAILHWLLVVMLLLAVGGIVFSALREHKNYLPIVPAIVGAAAIYLARWGIGIPSWLLYPGIVLLISASLWNLKLRKKASCPKCEMEGGKGC